MKDYTHYGIEIAIASGNTHTEYRASLFIEGCNTTMADILRFSDECKAIVKAIRKALKSDCTIHVEFSRFDYNSETDNLHNIRTASGFTSPKQFIDEEGVYLYDKHHYSEADYWLDSKADLLEAFRDFADNSTYFHNDIYL